MKTQDYKSKEIVELQKKLGCSSCQYADKRALSKRACCTLSHGYQIDDVDGHCFTRKELVNN